jgi:hypothetical protein
MVRLSDSPGDSVLTAAKESAESEGRARNLAILHCTEAFSLALRLFIFVIGGSVASLADSHDRHNALCNTIVCNGFQSITCVAK